MEPQKKPKLPLKPLILVVLCGLAAIILLVWLGLGHYGGALPIWLLAALTAAPFLTGGGILLLLGPYVSKYFHDEAEDDD